MSAFVLLNGSLHRQPEQRTARTTGQLFVKATIKVASGNEIQFWNVTAFSETAAAELMRLDAGEKVSIQGVMKIETYEREGEKRTSLNVTADVVVALKQPIKSRTSKPKPAKTASPARTNGANYFPDDSVPF